MMVLISMYKFQDLNKLLVNESLTLIHLYREFLITKRNQNIAI